MDSNSQIGEGSSKGKGYLTWTPQMDKILSSCFVDQMNQGNRLDGKFAWKAVSWTAAINALREGLNIYVTKGNIQSRLKTWEKHHEIISNMLSTSGFSWNYDKGRVEVEERVWNAYVQVHTKAVPYRRKIVIDNWDDICAIFAQDRANGEGAQTAFETDIEMATNEVSNNLEETFGTNDRGLEDERALEDDATNTSGGQRKSSSSSLSRGKKRKERGSETMYNVLGRMADSLDRFLNSEPSKPTTQAVLDEVSKVTGLDETQVLKSVDLLMHDQRKFDTFSGLPAELKKPWILMHLGR
ncbi:hypothetical protein LguiA_008227 [Lonicera macranthoides]